MVQEVGLGEWAKRAGGVWNMFKVVDKAVDKCCSKAWFRFVYMWNSAYFSFILVSFLPLMGGLYKHWNQQDDQQKSQRWAHLLQNIWLTISQDLGKRSDNCFGERSEFTGLVFMDLWKNKPDVQASNLWFRWVHHSLCRQNDAKRWWISCLISGWKNGF